MFPFAKKSLGQNFLTSEGALRDILSAADVQKDDVVLEIGPGRGVLTKKLLEAGAQVIAVEKDRELVPVLADMFSSEVAMGQLTIIEADILEYDIASFVTIHPTYKLIANIPYYITGQIFRMFLEGVSVPPSCMTLLVQKEVAERVVARDGKESILSISVKAYGVPQYVATVKRGSFTPAPNVDSAILHIGSISKKFFETHGMSEMKFFEVVKAAFAHKRKMIEGNLKDAGFVVPETVNNKARAEDLGLNEFAILTQVN